MTITFKQNKNKNVIGCTTSGTYKILYSANLHIKSPIMLHANGYNTFPKSKLILRFIWVDLNARSVIILQRYDCALLGFQDFV
jgi:hypothetical protein